MSTWIHLLNDTQFVDKTVIRYTTNKWITISHDSDDDNDNTFFNDSLADNKK